jgi:ribosomal protein S12 methylthiotransferase
MALQRRISAARNKQLIGREFPVIVEGISKETDLLWEARLSTQAPEIDGVCYINDFGPGEPRPGEMRTLRVSEAHDYDLIGELIDAPERSYGPPLGTANPFPILGTPSSSQRAGAIR